MARLSDKDDKMVLSMVSSTISGSGQKDSFLIAVKAHLDNNYAVYRLPDGTYTVPHIKAAVATLMNRTK